MSSLDPISVGVLHSLTGSMAESELPVCAATLFALDEVGEILGQELKPIVFDGRSDENHFENQAHSLVKEHKVPAIFGCWRSVDRVRAVDGMRNDCLLVYPVQYEGFPRDQQVLHMGSTPNQQLIPALDWYFDEVKEGRFPSGKIVFLGSNYLYPLWAEAIIVDVLAKHKQRLAHSTFLEVEAEEKRSKKDRTNLHNLLGALAQEKKTTLILNTINGIDNEHFFKSFTELKRNGDFHPDCQVISFCLGETEIERIGAEWAADTFISTCYLESLDNTANETLKDAYTSWITKNRSSERHIASGWTLGSLVERAHPCRIRVSDPMQKAILGVQSWARLADRAGNAGCANITALIRGGEIGRLLSRDSPEERVEFVSRDMHWKRRSRVGQVHKSGTVKMVHETGMLLPKPFLGSKKFPNARTFFRDAGKDALKYTNPSEAWVKLFQVQPERLKVSTQARKSINSGEHDIPPTIREIEGRKKELRDVGLESIIDELKKHNCSDQDYLELFSLFDRTQGPATDQARRYLALSAAKIKALVYRIASDTKDTHRVYLFDLLHFAAMNSKRPPCVFGAQSKDGKPYLCLEDFRLLMGDPRTESVLRNDKLQKSDLISLFDLAADGAVTHYLLSRPTRNRYVMVWCPEDLERSDEGSWNFERFLWGDHNLSSKFKAVRCYFAGHVGEMFSIKTPPAIESLPELWEYARGVTVELSYQLIEQPRMHRFQMRVVGVIDWNS